MEFLVLQMEYIIIFILLVFITVYVMNYVVYYIILCQSGLDAYPSKIIIIIIYQLTPHEHKL